MKERDGRPLRSLAAWRAIEAREELEARFPSVVALIDMLAVQNVDPRHVDAALAEALAEVTAGRNRTRGELLEKSSAAERQLHAAAAVERLSQDHQALAALDAAVAAELKAVSSQLAKAEMQLRRAVLEGDPVNRFERALVGKLRAAGVTDIHARTMGVDQVNLVRDFINGTLPSNFRGQFQLARQNEEVALAWSADNPWIELLADTPGFRLNRHTMPVPSADIRGLRRCGLPPFRNLEESGYEPLFRRFEAANTPRLQRKACWDVCEKWIAQHIIEHPGPENVAVTREEAWSFLFGVRYGFAHEVEGFDGVPFPSPWSPDEYIVATRIRGPAEPPEPE
jgi:hypothetical protein